MVASSFGPGYDSAGSSSYNIQVNWNDDSGQNIDTNVSTVTATAYLSATNGGFDGFTCYYYLEINGTKVGEATTKLWGWTGSSQRQFATGSVAVTHTADGSKDIVIKAYFDDTDNTTSYTPKDVTIARTVTLTNLVRPPLAPAAGPTIVRSADGTSITTITSQPAASYTVATVATTRYDYRWSNDNGTNWTTVTGSTSPVNASFPTLTGADPSKVYLFQTRATNTEGTSGWSPSSSAYATPFITSVSRVGTNVTVAVSPNSNNGGSTITGHVVEYSLDQSTWTGAQTIAGATGGSTTFTNLPPGKTYYIRAYATNQASINSPYQTYLGSPVTATEASIFVSAYGRRYFTSGNITNVAASGGDITYTASNSFTANDVVTITGVSPSQYNLTNATLKSATPTQFVITNAATGTYSSSTGTASGWALVLSGKRIDAVSGNITNVTTSGGDVTYTASNSFSTGDNVTISGVTPTAFNLVNATIKSATSTQFVITNAATGTYSSSTGKAGRFVTLQTVKKYTAGAWVSFS